MKLFSVAQYPAIKSHWEHPDKAGNLPVSKEDIGHGLARGATELGLAAIIAGYGGRLSDRLQIQWQKAHGSQPSPIEHARQLIQTSHGTLHKEADATLRKFYYREVADRILVELLKEKGSGWAINVHPSGSVSGTSGTSRHIAERGANMGGPHVGQIHAVLWAPFIAGAYGGSALLLGAHYGEDTLSYMKHVDAAVDALWEDIVRDICAHGSVKTDDVAKSSSNPFGIVAAETDGYPGWGHSECSKRGFPIPPLPGQTPHIKSDWLTAFNYWVQDWRSYVANDGKGWADMVGFRPDRAQLDTWYTQLEGTGGWRSQAGKAGVTMITPAADAPAKPTAIPWTAILIVGGLLAGAILLGQVRSFVPTRIIPSLP
jgi:hypothetical protein